MNKKNYLISLPRIMQCCCLANIDLDHNFEYKIIVAIPILIWEGEFSEKWVHVVYFKSHLPQATEKEHRHFEVEML